MFSKLCIPWAVILFGAGVASLQALPDQYPINLSGGPKTASATHGDSRPNIVFIITDDQDLHLRSLDYVPYLRKHLIERGTQYKRHFCTIALCCPSRVNLWTGKAAHNTNVTDVAPPYGGYPKFVQQGLNEDFLPVWLQDAGYNTYYTGKLFNAHTVFNYHSPHVKGFTGSDFLVDPFTYQYLNATFQRNHDPPVSYEGQYSTDILAEKAYGFLDDAVGRGGPFFLGVAPIAPHANVGFVNYTDPESRKTVWSPPVSAERHKHLFKDVIVPRTDNFNPDKPSSVNWINKLPKQDEENVAFNDHFYRQRLRALQAVDELVDGIFQRLERHGILENTYVIYTTDNGYHIGQHRLQPGKTCSFEEDINVPLIIRGPGVPENETTDIVTTHTDLAPTILSIAQQPLKAFLDGAPIPLSRTEIEKEAKTRHEHVNVEFWGWGIGEGDFGGRQYANNTYKALRVISGSYNLHYTVWCNNAHELYDLNSDPGQLHNLLAENEDNKNALLGYPLQKIVSRLDSLLFVLKSCKGQTCLQPWRSLHPEGNVENLREALASRFDQFYEYDQKRISYSRCENGYIVDAEGPQFEKDGLLYRHGSKWYEWA